jgi:phosphoglycerate dehydrogenase-like enzyme
VPTKPLVIQTEDLDPLCVAWLSERCEVVRCYHTKPEFPDLLRRADALVVRTYTRVDEALLAGAPNLKVLGRAGVALENVDVGACLARGVQVCNTPGSNTRAVVEFFTALLMDAVRPRVFLEGPLEGEDWHQARRELVAPRELGEMTIGIWGFGRIGSAVARVARALDMRMLYHDIVEIAPDARSGATPVPLDTLLAESDVLTIHIDYRQANRHALNSARLAQLKDDALIINTSRGFVIDPGALADFLNAHPSAQAVLDVHDPFEPMSADYPLLGVDNAFCTPHLASGTERAKREMSWVVRDVWRVLSGEKPENPPPKFLLDEAAALR